MYFFSRRIVELQNKLPTSFVESSSANVLKDYDVGNGRIRILIAPNFWGNQSTGCPIKNDPQICFCNNFGKCTPILIPFSLLQQENHGAQNLSYISHLTFIMLPLYLAKQTLMLYQCHYYIIIVFVYNLLHFNAFNHLHRLIWAAF